MDSFSPTVAVIHSPSGFCADMVVKLGDTPIKSSLETASDPRSFFTSETDDS
jgi:hypothetical protein